MFFFFKKLKLTNFRNHQSKELEFSSPITVIYGNNGVGKTNILEAVSIFSKNGGFKDGAMVDLLNKHLKVNNFTIYAQTKNDGLDERISINYNKLLNQKTFYINGLKNNNFSLACVSLIPQMDDLFSCNKDVRRKFLDKMVCDIEQHHQKRVNSYSKLIRERMNFLQKFHKSHDKWIDVIEEKIAQLGVLIAISRNNLTKYINHIIAESESDFLKSELKIIGEVEEKALSAKALDVENIFAQKLKEDREFGIQAGRTSFGVHRSDFTSISAKNSLEAKYCSTGEQKSMLISLALGRVKMIKYFNKNMPIVFLLDEITSHIDSHKILNLLLELKNLEVQCFITGVRKDYFAQYAKNNNDIDFIEIRSLTN